MSLDLVFVLMCPTPFLVGPVILLCPPPTHPLSFSFPQNSLLWRTGNTAVTLTLNVSFWAEGLSCQHFPKITLWTSVPDWSAAAQLTLTHGWARKAQSKGRKDEGTFVLLIYWIFLRSMILMEPRRKVQLCPKSQCRISHLGKIVEGEKKNYWNHAKISTVIPHPPIKWHFWMST